MRKLEDLTALDYLTIIRRRIWYLVITTILVTAGAVFYVRQMPYVFESETTISVSNRIVPIDYIGTLDRESASQRIEFVRQQLQSRAFLTRIAQEFQLAPLGAPVDAAAAAVSSGTLLTMLTGNTFRLSYRSADPALAQAVTSRLAETVIQLNESFRNEQVQVTDQFLEDEMQGASVRLADAQERYSQFLRQQFGLSIQSDSAVARDLEELRGELTIQEVRLTEAMAERDALDRRLVEQEQLRRVARRSIPQSLPDPSETPALPMDTAPVSRLSPQVLALEAELTAKREELAAASRRYTESYPIVIILQREVRELENEVREALDLDALNSFVAGDLPGDDGLPDPSDAPTSPLLILPEVDATVDVVQTEIQFALRDVTSRIEDLERTRANLGQRISLLERRLDPPPDTAMQLIALEREYEAAREDYQLLSGRRLNAAMAVRVDADERNQTFRVIDEANLPVFAVAPNKPLLALVGCLAGLLLGIGAAFGRELLDPSMHDESEAALELNLPVLAGVPSVPAPKERKLLRERRPLAVAPTPAAVNEKGEFRQDGVDPKIQHLFTSSSSIGSESFRLMHATLSRLQKENGIKVVLVASAVPGEGKTYTTSCLAAMMARQPGTKVLIVDGDLRARSLSRLFGLNDDHVGFDDLLQDSMLVKNVWREDRTGEPTAQLVGKPSLEQTIVKGAKLNLYVLPAGHDADPAKLMNTDELERVIEHAKLLFDWVIIDSPSVLAVADANLLAPICDAALFVVRAGKTPGSLVREAIERLGKDRVCGVLMNQVRTNMSDYHYYKYDARSREAVDKAT